MQHACPNAARVFECSTPVRMQHACLNAARLFKWGPGMGALRPCLPRLCARVHGAYVHTVRMSARARMAVPGLPWGIPFRA
jgi:hypothetical protein